MARPPSIDLAAAMEADLKAHDPMSTRPHVPVTTGAYEHVRTSSYAPLGTPSHETTSASAHDEKGSSSHGLMSEVSHETVGRSTHEEEGSRSHGLTSPDDDTAGRVPAYVPPSRAGMKRIQGYFSPRVKRQMRLLAVNKDLSEEDLVARALNLLFKTEGLPEIAFDNKEQRRGS